MHRAQKVLSEDKQRKALELRAIYEQLWLDALNALHEQGLFRDDPFIIRRLLTGMTGWAPNWFDRAGSLTLDDLADIIVRRVVGEA